MAFTRTQLIANTREMMDAVSSARWGDTYIATVLGLIGVAEWEGILGANPMYRFNQVSLTAAAAGTFAYSSLTTGTGNSAKNFYRILSVTDGASIVYQQRDFREMPLATVNGAGIGGSFPYGYVWYDAGDNGQIIPVGANALVVSVNWTPTTIDALAAAGDSYDFPAGHESILWLMASAFLLEKGAAEADAANVLRASTDLRR